MTPKGTGASAARARGGRTMRKISFKAKAGATVMAMAAGLGIAATGSAHADQTPPSGTN